MVWTPALNGCKLITTQAARTDGLPTMGRENQAYRPRTTWKGVIRRDLDLMTEWNLEEAAAKSGSRCRDAQCYLTMTMTMTMTITMTTMMIQ